MQSPIPSSSPSRAASPTRHASSTPTAPAGFSTAPATGGNPPSPPTLLRAIRAGRHDEYDRVVFEFGDAVPAYAVHYVARLTEDPSGRPVALRGSAVLLVVMNGATLDTTPQVVDPRDARSYDGPRRFRPGLVKVEELAVAGDFEAVLSVGLGVAGRRPFRVLRLAEPGRIAVDIAVSG